MPDGRVRALCARIAIEIEPEKVDALIAELRKVLLDGDYRAVEVQALAEELLRDAPRPKPQN